MIIPPAARILPRAALIERFGRPRTQRVVFTNGVFDLLHRGHVEYLYAARELGDALVVGLNSDASVRALKGPSRPVNTEADRAIVLAGLGCVDAVTIFAEDTPAALIDLLVPDVLVKGGDYRPDQVVGRQTVEAAGGRLVIIPFVIGHSTTGTLQRIQEDLK
ncbi:MAG TPA: D-glycero-beta-D-manno-heptose 1-phosphate adenylyltransferase [Longimicrobiales bacterium]